MRKQPSEYHKQDIGSIYYPWAWESKGVNVSPEPRSILVNISCLFCVRRYCGGEPNTRLQTCTFCQISSCIKLEIKSMLVTQSCLTFCDLMDCGPWCFPVNEIHQTRMLEWVAIPSPGDFPNPGVKPWSPALQADSLSSEPPRKASLSRNQLNVMLQTVAHKAPLSMGFSRQEYWSGLPCPLQGIFLTQGSNPYLLQLLHW